MAFFGQQEAEIIYKELIYGTNHEDHISKIGEVDYYSFEGASGDVIMIRMRDETLVDSYIKLYDPDDKMIASAWSDGGLAKIRNLKLHKAGTYRIHAYDRNHNDIGKYGISLHQLNSNGYAKPIPEIISFEDHIEEIVGVRMYEMQADKGDVLFTQMRAKTVHLECEFFIYDSEGNEIYKAENKGRLATVGPVEVEKSDHYTIVVTDRGGNDLDKFGLTHMLLNKHESAQNLVCGENKNDRLDKLVQRNAFRIRTRPGQIALIEARSNNIVLETTMMIYNQEGQVVRKKSSTNKLISETLPVSDTEQSYLVAVFDRNGNDFGDFGIQAQFLDDSYCPSILNCSNQEELVYFDGLAQNKLFSIEGQKGEPIQVELKETEPLLEPHLRMFDLNGNMIAEAYDGVKAKLNDYNFPYDGKFLILASDRSGNDLGAFTLSAPASLESQVEISECQTVYPGYEPLSSVILEAKAQGNGLSFMWNTGVTTSTIEVSLEQSTNYSVTVTSSSGCKSVAETYVEALNVSCGNGNGEPKVEVCHVKNNGTHQTLCISINGVEEHLENGVGHIGCHMGPCDHQSPCEEYDKKIADGELKTKTRATSHQLPIFPNPTSSVVNISLKELTSEEITVQIFDANGRSIMMDVVENEGQTLSYNLVNLNLSRGTYFIAMFSEDFFETRPLILLE